MPLGEKVVPCYIRQGLVNLIISSVSLVVLTVETEYMLKEQMTKFLSGIPGRAHSLGQSLEEGQRSELLPVDGMGGEGGRGWVKVEAKAL